MAWPDVLRALDRDSLRSLALNRFRDRGFDAETFGRFSRARLAMAEALTATEDWAELAHPRWDLGAVREVRRRLEAEQP